MQFKSLLASLLVALTIGQSHGAPGDVDLSFDPGSAINGELRAIARQSDGKILIGGSFTAVQGAVRSGIARLNIDGSVDETFLHNMAGAVFIGFDLWVEAIAVQRDGKVLIGGYFTTVNGTARTHLARLNADGSLDTAFLSGMAGPDWGVGSVVLQSDGKILIVGSFSSINGVALNGFARLNADGSVDASFHFGGGADDVTLQNDGKMLIWRGNELTRLKTDGSIDSSFAVSIGTSEPTYSIRSVAVQRDGKILVGGWFNGVNGVPRNCFARLNADGSLDSSFLQGLAGMDNDVLATAEQDDGKILIGGWFSTVNGTPRPTLARLNADGSLDTSFLNGLAGLEPNNGAVLGFQVQEDAKILIRGFFSSINGVGRSGFARLNSDGSLDGSFLNDRTGPNGEVRTIALQNDAKILIGGNFAFVNGIAQSGIARLNPDGSLDSSFMGSAAPARAPGDNPPVFCIALQRDAKILIGGQFTSVNGMPKNYLARLNSNGSLDSTFVASIEAGDNILVTALAVQIDGKILISGWFSSVNGVERTNIARLNADGSLDGSFLGPRGCEGSHIAVQRDGKILVSGSFSSFYGVELFSIARLNADGSLDSSFSAVLGARSIVGAFLNAIQSDGKILISGQFSSVNGVQAHNFARLNTDGSLDSSFPNQPAGTDYGGNCLALQSDGKILVQGCFGPVNGVMRNRLARLNPDGSLDTTFLSGQAGPNAPAACAALQPDGKILCAGGFTFVNGTPRSHVARLMGDDAAPILISGPTSRTAEIGSTASFSVRAAGSPVPTCQWFFNGNVPVGSVMTNWILNLSNVQPTQTGAYTVVVANVGGAVTSAPAMLNVIAPVERRPVPGVKVTGATTSLVNVDYADSLTPAPNWTQLGSVTLTGTSQYCFDFTLPLPPQRLYRAWQTGTPGLRPSLDLHLVPAITLTGTIGGSVRLDYINQFGPTDAWVLLATVPLTNTSQLYFDTSSIGQPPRLWRIVPGP